MSERMGRNEPCDCGSGKKYKKCCMATDVKPSDEGEVTRQKLSRVSSELIKNVMRYAFHYNSEKLKEEMIPVFFSFRDELPDTVKRPLIEGDGFSHWFYFHALIEDEAGKPASFAEHYLNEKGQQLDKTTQAYAHAILDSTYYSFYEVIDVNRGVSVTVRDLLLDKSYVVREKMGSEQMYPGLIFFAGVLDFNAIYTFVGLFGIPLKGNVRLELEQLKTEIQDELSLSLDEKTIHQFEVQEMLRACCMAIYHQTYGQIPTIVNKDGQTFEFNEVDYDVQSDKKTILEKLTAILPPDETPESLLDDAEKGVVEFPWLDKANPSAVGYSVLAHITLTDTTLTLETNATNRSAKLEILLEDYLKGDVIKQQHRRQSLDEALTTRQHNQQEVPTHSDALTETALAELENEFIKRHWENWVDEAIPALDNFTPREATNDPRMRKKLEALLLDFENDTRGHRSQKAEIDTVRKILGLTEQ